MIRLFLSAAAVLGLAAASFAANADGAGTAVIPRNAPISVKGDPKGFSRWHSPAVEAAPDGVFALTFSGSRASGSSGCAIAGFGPCNVDLQGFSSDWNAFSDLMAMPHERPEAGFKVHFGLWNGDGEARFDEASVIPVTAEYRQADGLTLGHGETLTGTRYTFESAYSSKARNHARPLLAYGGGTRFNTDRWVMDAPGAYVTYRHALAGRVWGEGLVTVQCNWWRKGRATVELSKDGESWLKVAAVTNVGSVEAAVPAAARGGGALFVRLRAEKPCLLQVKSYAFEAESRGPAVNVAGATRYVDAGGGGRAHLRPCSYFDVDYGELIVKDAAAAVWSAPSGRKVPRVRKLPEAKGRGVRVQLAAAEAEAVQAVVTAGEALSDLRARVELKAPGTETEALRVGYVDVKFATDAQGCRGLWPDPIFADGAPCALAAGENQPFWIRVRTSKATPKGVYRGRVVFTAKRADGADWRAETPLEAEVFGFVVPERNTLETAFGFSGYRVKAHQKLYSQKAYETVVEKYLKCFAEHRLSLYDPTGGAAKFKVTWKNLEPDPAAGEPVFDWTDWDARMEKGLRDYRMTTFRLRIDGLGGGNFASRVEPSIAGVKEGHPAYEKLLAKYLGAVEAHLREKGWLDMAYVYWFDEPEPNDYAFVMNGFRKLRQYAPGLRTMLTEQPEKELFGGPGIWCPVLHHLNAPATAARRKAGDTFWWYICCAPKAPYVGEFIDHPGTDLRVWLWQTWKEKVTGILVWDTTYWHSAKAYPGKTGPQNPYEDTMSWCSAPRFKDGVRIPWGNADGRFLYPPLAAADGRQKQAVLDGPVETIRIELLRDGIEDYEYFALLKRLLSEAKGLSPERRAACEALLAVPEDVTKSLTEYTEDPKPMEVHREKLARAIESLWTR